MRKAKKVECLRLPFSTPLPVLDRERSKFQKSRFLGMHFQVELPHAFRKFCPKLLGIRFAVYDSGPMWVANPLSCDFCIHYTSPV
jgi:hypothetical protein